MFRKQKIFTPSDIVANRELFKDSILVKNKGVWEILGSENRYELNTYLFDTLAYLGKIQPKNRLNEHCTQYKLVGLRLDKDEKYYKQLLRFSLDRKWFALIDLKASFEKLGYKVTTKISDRLFPAATEMSKVKCLVFEKDSFKLTLPYYSKIHILLNKNALFKNIVRVVCELYLTNQKYPYMVQIQPKVRLCDEELYGLLKREWDSYFRKVARKALEWAGYEEGQYDYIR